MIVASSVLVSLPSDADPDSEARIARIVAARRADITGDGWINVLDIIFVRINYQLSCAQ
jgi:hypothetical protein